MGNANTVLKLKDQVFGAGIPKICVPVTEPDAAGIVRELKRCAALPCSVVEWRADRFAEFRDARRTGQILMKAAAVFEDIAPEKLLLFTVRTASDGGEEVDRDLYFELCAAALGAADLVDVEFNAGADRVAGFVREARLSGTKVIVSYHDFEKTPSEEELIERMRAMQDTGADLVKVAVMPRTPEDAEILMNATRTMRCRYAEVPLVTMSMGELGRKSRIRGEEFGSAMTFASAGTASAPGQIALEELIREMEAFHKRSRS